MKAIWNWIVEKSKKSRQQGAALIVTLLVMLVLVLLALSIALQSQTEYQIAVNEQDSFIALSMAEAVMDRLNRAVRDYMTPFPSPTDLTPFLAGPNGTYPDTTDDGIPRITGINGAFTEITTITSETSITPLKNLNFTQERNTAIIVSKDFGDGSGAAKYLAFRMGMDSENPPSGNWDGPRAIVYVRMDDNYDGAPSAGSPNLPDNDFRMRARIIAEYPYATNSDETLRTPTRGLAVRKLVANFAPAGHVAIRTDGDLEISGSLELCGECGGAHANETIDVGSAPYSCSDVSATTGILDTDSANLMSPVQLTGEVYIPVINPYNDRFVP
ncbi:MAG: hypothetical protein L0287_30850, partial [Anaerolineae bacterium]|nr:hypothetical protein [Anaerolineae bacterium]